MNSKDTSLILRGSKNKKKNKKISIFFSKISYVETPLPGEAKPEFSQKKGVHHIMWLIFTMFYAQNEKKLMNQFREKGKNGHFCPVLTSPLPRELKPYFFQKLGHVTFLDTSWLAFMQSISKLYERLCENFTTRNDGDHFIEDLHLNSSRVQFKTLISQRIIWVGTNGFLKWNIPWDIF